MRVGDGALRFPVPWATHPEESAVSSPDEYREALEAAGFCLVISVGKFATKCRKDKERRNQNNTGNFDMIGGEFGAPQDPTGGTTWIMTGGTFNSLASEVEPRFGSMTMSGGTINANNFKWDEGRGGSSFLWNFSGGVVNVTDINGFNNTARPERRGV